MVGFDGVRFSDPIFLRLSELQKERRLVVCPSESMLDLRVVSLFGVGMLARARFNVFSLLDCLNLIFVIGSSICTLPLLAAGLYDSSGPPLSSMYLLSHCMVSRLSWYLHFASLSIYV